MQKIFLKENEERLLIVDDSTGCIAKSPLILAMSSCNNTGFRNGDDTSKHMWLPVTA